MENDKMFELMEKMYAEMQNGFKKVDVRLNKMDEGFDKTEGKLAKVEDVVLKIEDDHGKKIDALLDGYKQNSEQLARIESEVEKHEEVIIRRIK
ncbi:hypothetical protein KPL28_03595 [Clostridium algidicarnis]|uniref:hypothetical protein n=1 Tax=Clostridium algidicarnis TaxID=37659 RepID=UPI001C0DF2FE|nr:hypothetical protein [Clostridium algidicarnis]MBU3208721.1 hypothetical protein [Clostridium algidicarnis]